MRRRFAPELAQELDTLLFASPSHRSRQRVADDLAALSREEQDLVLHWVRVIAQTDAELAWQVCARARSAFRRPHGLSADDFAAWIQAVLAERDRLGDTPMLGRILPILDDLDGFLARQAQAEVALESLRALLGHVLRAWGGGQLELAVSRDSLASCDGEQVFLPAALTGVTPETARQRYLALIALACLQHEDADLAPRGTHDSDSSEPVRAWQAVLTAEHYRRRLETHWPGLVSALPCLIDGLGDLSDPQRRRALACERAAEPLPAGRFWRLVPWGARFATRLRQGDEALPKPLKAFFRAPGKRTAGDDDSSTMPPAPSAAQADEGSMLQGAVGDEPTPAPGDSEPPESASGASRAAGAAAWAPASGGSESAPAAAPPDADAVYDEWDYRRGAYRKDWCHVFVSDAPRGETNWILETRRQHAATIARVRRQFASLRGDWGWRRRQPDGPEIDLDLAVDALAQRHAPRAEEGELRVFRQRQPHDRAVAVAFLVDMSGSTKGWVNDAEREALLILVEAMQALGDAYAIYGFSGWTRRRCEVYAIKPFDLPDGLESRQRIAGIEARDYTRMGPAIRHMTGLLQQRPERYRLLITLSDGRPDDYGDEYRGRYGIEDTRRALHESRQKGIRNYCVTVDRHAADYLPQLYGSANYSVLAEPAALPRRIAEVYRRLVT